MNSFSDELSLLFFDDDDPDYPQYERLPWVWAESLCTKVFHLKEVDKRTWLNSLNIGIFHSLGTGRDLWVNYAELKSRLTIDELLLDSIFWDLKKRIKCSTKHNCFLAATLTSLLSSLLAFSMHIKRLVSRRVTFLG